MTKREFVKREIKRVFGLKIELEKTMIRELKSYFAKQKKRVRKNEGIETIEPLLKNHYERIKRKLMNGKKDEAIEESINAFLDGKSINRSRIIDKTTNEDMQESETRAREQLAEEGNVNPSEREVRAVSSGIFYRLSKGRVGNIANTETQENVEGMRQKITLSAHRELEDAILERDQERANELYEISSDYTSYKIKKSLKTQDVMVLLALVSIAKKTWVTIGDKLVRVKPFNHQAANGQEVGLLEPYIVSGQMLNYPGDTSLGASLGNIINCRCVSVNL